MTASLLVDLGFAVATFGALGYGWVLLQRDLRRKAEAGGGSPSVRLEAGWLIATSPGALASRCELRRVTTVAVSVLAGTTGIRRRVTFRGEGRCNCSVPLEAPGMREVMSAVSQWPRFDEEAWRQAVEETKAGRYNVWKGTLVVNTALESSAPRGNFNDGLVTEAGAISWDTTYDALRNTPGVSVIRNEFERDEYHVAGPVWLGRLRMDLMRVYAPVSINGSEAARTDVPVVEWNASVVITEAWGDNYVLLKQSFDGLFGPPDARSSYEREDQANRTWRVGEMILSIVYTYNSRNSNEMGYCSLAVRNGRRYPGYVEDAYTAGMRLEQLTWQTFLPGKVTLWRDYRRSYWVRRTPDAIRPQAAEGWVAWRDDAAGKLGFASGDDAVVVDTAQAERLELQNAAPARGRGYAQLKVIDVAGRGTLVASVGYRELDPLADEIGELTRLEVLRLQEYLDD